jgi:hypothetical protein
MPEGIFAGTGLPFEVRVTDTGNTTTTVPTRMVARPARRVWEGVHTAVPPGDAMTSASGDPAGPVFLLDGATVSIYPNASGPRRVSSLLIYAGGTGGAGITVHSSVLTAPEVTSYASAALFYPLELQVDELVAIGAGCSIDVSGRGLLGNTATIAVALPEETPAEPFAGGSHAGLGWFGAPSGGWTRDDPPTDYLARPGSAYDSVRDPRLPGSGGTGGAANTSGGRGGGVVRLLAESAVVRLAGDIRADGLGGVWGGGGAGGAILVRALRIDGRGHVSAGGGPASDGDQTGSGGGGRLALIYREIGTEVDLAAQAEARGGWFDSEWNNEERFGGAGTVYLEALDPASGAASGVGRLLIGNRAGRPAAVTPLPALGDGTLMDVDAAAGALTIEAPAAHGEIIGDSIVLTADDGAEIAAFPVTAQEHIAQAPGSGRRLRLTVAATEQQLADLDLLAVGSQVHAHGRARFGTIEGRGAARIAADDDLAVAPFGAANPPVNNHASLTLDGEARALLRGEAPQVTFTATPPPGSDVRVGSSIALEWTVTDSLGINAVTKAWSLTGAPSTRLLAEPQEVPSGASPLSLQVGGAAPGPVRYDVAATDLAGRGVAGSVAWDVLPNEPPGATIAFAAGTPAAVLPGTTVNVTVDASDIEGLQQITLRATGPVLVPSQSQLVSGSSAHVVFSVAITETAQSTDVVNVQAEVLDLFGSSPTPTTTLVLGILPDTEPPAVAIALAPQSTGDAYTAGDAVTVTVTATDNVAAHNLTLTIDGQAVSSPSSPLVRVWTAPAVVATTLFVLQAQASDPAGHQTTLMRTLTVQPLVNPEAPTIHFTCPSGGAYLPAGYDALVLEATATDDIGVASVEFFRAGDPSPFAIVAPSAGTVPTFAASATAPPLPAVGGQDVQLRARARDASNNFTDTTVTIHVVDAVTLDPSGNNDWPALATQIGVLRTGTLTLDQSRTLGGLIVLRGATITHAPSTPGAEKSVNLNVTGSLYVESGASIDVSGRGYAPAVTYPDAVAASGTVGGSHLGVSGQWGGTAGSTYGSVSQPNESGAGGREGNPTSGGGVVHLAVGGSLVIDGVIHASGGDTTWGGNGAGGSIWMSAGNLRGVGVVEARGGDAGSHAGGGGGAVAVQFGAVEGDILSRIASRGGTSWNSPATSKGGAGTMYVKGPSSTFGDLSVDNGGIDGQSTVLPALGNGMAQSGSTGATLITDRAVTIPAYFAGHWVEVSDASGALKGTWRIATVADRTVALRANGGEAINIQSGDHWQGVYRFDSVTVKGRAKLDSFDGARVGEVSVEAGSQLLWFDDTPPVINPTRITINAHDGAFWVVGSAGAVVDPGGIASALLRNRRTDETTAITIASDGRFGPIRLTGLGNDLVEVEATSSHEHPVTSKAIVGTLPANTGAPAIVAGRVALTRDGSGHWHVAGSPGAVGDAEPPISLNVQAQPSGVVATGFAGADGSFDLVIACASGDSVTLTATDGHPQPQSASIGLGVVPGNAPPVVDTGAITITYAGPVEHGEWREEAGYVLHVGAGAIADNEGRLDLEVRHGADEPWTRTIESGEAFDWRLEWGSMKTGDRLELIVTDRDPTEPMSTTVELGPLPPDNYGPPVFDQEKVSLLPLGFGFQIAGRAGAVVDPDGPVTITVSNPARTWTSQPIAVDPDGYFYARFQGVEGDEIALQARDGHPDLPLTGEPIHLGTLPAGGVVVAPVALGGHTVTRLRGWQASLDGGTLVAQPTLRWRPEDADDETVGSPLGGLAHAADWVSDNRTGSPLLLDGTDLVPWVCADGGDCPIQSPGRLQVISSGALMRGITHAGYLFLASEGDGASFHVLLPPLVDGTTGAISAACNGEVATLALPVPSGAHVLEVFPAFPGRMAVLTDLPGSELLLIDVTTPTAPAFVGAVDLEGSGTPSWSVWNGGELLLGRADGSVEIWRWGDSAPVLFARWLPSGAAVRGAARTGDQLWVGLADGRLQQVDLLAPASPRLVGEMQLGEPVVGILDLERSLLVATETGLFHVWPRVMPPEINPDSVAWGQEIGWSWARVYASSLEDIVSTSVRWGDAEGTYNSEGYIYEVFDGIATPPTIRATDVLGVSSGDYTPSAWQPWGLWAATGDIDWFPRWEPIAPSDCSSLYGTFGNTNHDVINRGGVPWIATAASGASAVELAFYPDGSAWWSDPPARRTLPAAGVVAGVVGFDTTLLVLADGLDVWDLADPASPALASHVDLLGNDPVSAARLVDQDRTLVLLAAGGDPGRVVPIDVAEPANPVAGAELVLPGMLGAVIDLQHGPDGTLFLLTNDGAAARLFRYDVGDPAAATLLAQAGLPPGAPPVAMDVGYAVGETPRSTFVAVAREGWGVEVYAAGTLALLHSLPLPGVPRDVRFVPENGNDPARIIVTAGFGHGLISIEGLPDQPHVGEVHSIGDLGRFAQRGEWSNPPWSLPSRSKVEVLTPGGFVVQPLPHRRVVF